jgi:transposase
MLSPPDGYACWNGRTLAETLDVSDDRVWEVLRKENIQLERHRSWCVSTDPEFEKKSADVIGLYLNPPFNAIVISIDEKPSIQALERAVGYIQTPDKKTTHAYKSTYKRNGILNLYAALDVHSGQVHHQTTERKTREDFRSYLTGLLSTYPEGTEIHAIMDNYAPHKKNEEWLKENFPNVTFHFTPTSASWLNQIEVWFSIFSRHTLKGASFSNTEELANKIHEYVEHYNAYLAKPFKWTKRAVK